MQDWAERVIRMGGGLKGSGLHLDGAHLLRSSLSVENGRKVVDMLETTRRILLPARESAKWKCSECAWSQPFVQRLEIIPNEPPKAIGDAFDRHKCAQHRHPKWVRAIP